MLKVSVKKRRPEKNLKRYFSKTNKIKYGGKPPLERNIFRIYTTGIADDGNMGPSSYGSEWNSFVRERILQLIPPNYTNIEIYHHDILYNDESIEKKQMQIDFINTVVVQNDLLNTRVNSSVFLNTILDITTTSPFIVFDYAHLFTYINPNLISCSTYVIIDRLLYPSGSRSVPKRYRGQNLENSYTLNNIKSVYLGYSDSSTTRNNYVIKSTNVFTVNTNGRVITYIDELFTRKLPAKITETLTPEEVDRILLAAIKENIKKELGLTKFNENFSKSASLQWVLTIIHSIDNKHIEFPELIISASIIAIEKIKSNIDKNESFWLKFK